MFDTALIMVEQAKDASEAHLKGTLLKRVISMLQVRVFMDSLCFSFSSCSGLSSFLLLFFLCFFFVSHHLLQLSLLFFSFFFSLAFFFSCSSRRMHKREQRLNSRRRSWPPPHRKRRMARLTPPTLTAFRMNRTQWRRHWWRYQ